MRVVTITKGGYVDSLPKIQRPVVLHRIANIREENIRDQRGATVVRVAGQHYDSTNRV